MKAIHQIISFLHERGRLRDDQLKELVKKGYWGQYKSSDLRLLEKKIGQSFPFEVTGDGLGPLWGTDIYTSDSNLGTACVHAGVLQVGESGVVKVTIVDPLPVFDGSHRHGVQSDIWTTGWSGAFQVEALGK